MSETGGGDDGTAAEAALRGALDDIFSGSGRAIFQDFTSAAYVDLLHLMPQFSDLPTPEGYELLGSEGAEDEYRFEVRILTPGPNVDLFMVMKDFGAGKWKVAAITVSGN